MGIPSFQYHDRTSYDRHQLSGHYMDWNNQPSVYKTYPGLTPIPLSESPLLPQTSLSKILKEPVATPIDGPPTMEVLSRIFRLTYSLTAKAATSGGSFYYRSVASAGALYPTELYLAMPNIPGLTEGLYHYSIASPGLSPLREGNFFSFLQSSAKWPEGFQPGVVFLFTTIFFRSAWKYRDRSFRYHLLDTGHVIENLLMALKATNQPWALSYDFDDPKFNHFLGLDPTREAVLALVAVPGPFGKKEKPVEPLPDLDDSLKGASHVAQKETPYPIIQEIVRAGWKPDLEEKTATVMALDLNLPTTQWTSVIPADTWPEKINFPAAVLHRRSKRNFIPEPLPSQAFRSLIEGLSVDRPGTPVVPERAISSLSIGLLVGQVEGVSSGFYLLNRETLQLGLIKEGRLLKSMAQVCLDQMWLAQAGLQVLFLSNLVSLDHNQGPRGYRYAMISAGRLGERLYLLSSAMGLGCCGIGAFYDQEAADLLGLDEAGRLVYLVAVGVVKK